MHGSDGVSGTEKAANGPDSLAIVKARQTIGQVVSASIIIVAAAFIGYPSISIGREKDNLERPPPAIRCARACYGRMLGSKTWTMGAYLPVSRPNFPTSRTGGLTWRGVKP